LRPWSKQYFFLDADKWLDEQDHAPLAFAKVRPPLFPGHPFLALASRMT
jgi:hypothetical protein